VIELDSAVNLASYEPVRMDGFIHFAPTAETRALIGAASGIGADCHWPRHCP
jgi:hypothetical protein